MMRIVTLCTGNVARSVMLGFMLTTLDESRNERWQVRSAGTHVTEGSAISGRTRDALLTIEELRHHRFGSHRSHQLDGADTAWADVILAAEVSNVNYVGRSFPAGAHKTVQLAQFVRWASRDADLGEQLRAVNEHSPSADFDVADPAGGDQAQYDLCARQLWDLAQAFADVAGDGRSS